MKKKISVFTLLLSLMLSFVVPVSAIAATETTADDVKYSNVEEFMHEMGYTSFAMIDDRSYMVFANDNYLGVYSFSSVADKMPYCFTAPGHANGNIFIVCRAGISKYYYDYYYPPTSASLNNNYNVRGSNDYPYNTQIYYNSQQVKCAYIRPDMSGVGYFDELLYSDFDVFQLDNFNTTYQYTSGSGTLVFESSLFNGYSFVSWCNDANLNCIASSNESPLKIPYSYNEYWHIVRKTSNGKWLLTTIGNSVLQENISDYRLLVGENGNLHVASIYSGDDVNGYKINVRQYEYDTDGWKVRTYETLDTRDSSGLVDLGAGSGFDDTRVLVYTSESIYDHNGSVPLYEKSTEYFDVTNTPDTPDTPDEPDSPTPTPTTSPGSGSGRPGSGTRPDTGGQATGGGGLDFIINLFTMIWTKICSVPMSVDGYSINLQQIVIYGALVSIVGGFIMHFIFGRK